MSKDHAPAELVEVVKRYGAIVALDRVDLALRPGEVLALLGANGAGKTTAVRLLLGLSRPSEGQALVFGEDPRRPATRRRVGVMLQIGKVPETLTVREHVQLFSTYYPAPLPVDETLRRAGLAALGERRFGRLSGGERQRVLFALAICGRPDVLVLDEPTVGLDVESRRGMWRQLAELAAAGTSILLTTHVLAEADALAHRIVLLDRGRVLAEGTPAQVKASASSRRVRCVTSLAPAELATWPGVIDVTRDRAALEIRTGNAEALVTELLRRDPGLSELEVSSVALEDAFLALVGSDAQEVA